MLNSSWRQQRLVILCYHGVSLQDEHLWAPELYVEASQLRERFEYLRQKRCNVLGLDEAVQRLYEGTLPKKAVAITFDDGTYDFYRLAFPILKELELEATVYLTTYYSGFNRPVFDVMSRYLLWKGRGQTLEFPDVLDSPVVLNPIGRIAADREVKGYARRNNLSARDKDQLLGFLAQRLDMNYEALCRQRILHIMTPAEVKEVARAGIDIQLHTHRHRVSQQQNLFNREIEENRQRIAAVTAKSVQHFCYPGGYHLSEFPHWLERCGVKSATTCEAGIATRRTNPFLLPRLVDSTRVTPIEFRSWVSGVADLFPQRPHLVSSGQLLEQDT